MEGAAAFHRHLRGRHAGRGRVAGGLQRLQSGPGETTTSSVSRTPYAGISELAGEARRRGARVFICTLAPGRPGRVQIPTSALQAINDRLRQVARSEGAVLVDLYSALLPEVNANVSIDGLHLTPLGYRRVAETVFAAIRADLEIR